MESITIKMKDGSVRKFWHNGRAGGNYTIRLRYEGAFAIVQDEWYNDVAIPSADIAEIQTKNDERW